MQDIVHTIRSMLARVRRPLARAMLGAAVAATGVPALAQAADWPSGPITFVVPFTAGGGGDTLARLYARQLSKTLQASIVVDNRPGAGGNIGTAAVAKAAPDGNTLVFGTNGTMGTNHALYKSTGFSIDAFEPVAMFGQTSLALAVGPDSPFHSVQELIAHARQKPRELTCASGGNGTASHVACVMLQQLAGIQVEHVPYKASANAVIDLKTNRVSFFIDVMPPLMPHIKQGGLRALAVTMGKRVPALPDTPTMIESGVAGFEHFAWDGIFAPKGTPEARLDKLHAAAVAAISDPGFRQDMLARGTVLDAMARKDFAALVQRDHVRVGDFVKKLGLTID